MAGKVSIESKIVKSHPLFRRLTQVSTVGERRSNRLRLGPFPADGARSLSMFIRLISSFSFCCG